MLDHIAVTRMTGKERTQGAYMLRAELQSPPAADWLARFQSAWYGSPECRKICSNLKTDGASIYIRFRDSSQIDQTVSALRSLVSQTESDQQHAARRNQSHENGLLHDSAVPLAQKQLDARGAKPRKPPEKEALLTVQSVLPAQADDTQRRCTNNAFDVVSIVCRGSTDETKPCQGEAVNQIGHPRGKRLFHILNNRVSGLLGLSSVLCGCTDIS